LRLPLRVAAAGAALVLCLPPHYMWRILRRPSPWPRIFLGSLGRIAGMRPRIIGTPLERNVLFVCNHLSWLDIMLVAGATGSSFVSRDDVADWPVAGWLARLNNTIFVARTSRRSVHGQADALRAALASGHPVALFPEGTTEGGHEVLPFRASLFAAVVPPPDGVKVQPVAIDYGPVARDISWTGNEPAGRNAKRVLSRPGTADVTLRFLEPIDPRDLPDRKRLAEQARLAILHALDASA